jgi:8-oxo-dGTP diphosphatase
MIRVRFYDPSYTPPGKIIYSVISARFEGQWIFVRHTGRNTWEIPGGHIEEEETPGNAAARELTEETGALLFNLVCVATYSVEKEGDTGYGMLYFAEVTKLYDIPDTSEIAETMLADELPDDLTYPDIQPHMFRKINEFLKERS